MRLSSCDTDKFQFVERLGRGVFAIIQDRKYLVSKYSLIKFLASDKGFAMQPKSEWHEKAIKWFVEVMHK